MPVQTIRTSGHKGPPSAPPSIPPIIITPFDRHSTPAPALDPRRAPPGPPVMPPPRPGMRIRPGTRR